MTKRGRKSVKPSIALFYWVLVELARDREDPRRERDSARNASQRLEERLNECLPGARRNEWETIRRYYKKFEKTRHRPSHCAESEMAQQLLEAGRQNRAVLGWKTSTWLLIPGMLSGLIDKNIPGTLSGSNGTSIRI
jgi:hypothetical protein